MEKPMTTQPTIKNLVVFVKLSDGSVREVIINSEMKKEIFNYLNKYQITVGEDVSEVLKFKK